MRVREFRISRTGAEEFYVAATETLRAAIEFRIDLAHQRWADNAAASGAADSF